MLLVGMDREVVRCDLAALQRGAVDGDEVCEIAGVGPIPIDKAVELLGEATWRLLITRGVDVLNVTTLSRKATAAMLASLAWRSPGCTAEGCGRTITQIDHRVPYAETRHTTLSELDPPVRPPPRSQDLRRLGAGDRHGYPPVRPSRRSPPPSTPRQRE